MPTTTRTDRLNEVHDRLTEAVESIVSGDDWQRMLRTAAKFHKDSFNNQLMIFMQRPDATLVAGFRRWQELGRQVQKGVMGLDTGRSALLLHHLRLLSGSRQHLNGQTRSTGVAIRIAGFRLTASGALNLVFR